MSGGHSAFITGVVAGLRDTSGDIVIRVEFGALGLAQLNPRNEAERLIRRKKPKHFLRLFIDDLDCPIILCPKRRVEEAITGRQVQKRIALLKQPVAERNYSFAVGHTPASPEGCVSGTL